MNTPMMTCPSTCLCDVCKEEKEADYRENLARIGETLIETTSRNCPGWAPMDCPSEIVVDLVNERDELKAELAQLQIDYDRACARVAELEDVHTNTTI